MDSDITSNNLLAYFSDAAINNYAIIGIGDNTNDLIFKIAEHNDCDRNRTNKKLYIFDADNSLCDIARQKYSMYDFVKVYNVDAIGAIERCCIDKCIPDFVLVYTAPDAYANSKSFAMFCQHMKIGSYFAFTEWNLGGVDDFSTGYSVIIRNLLRNNFANNWFRGWKFDREFNSVGIIIKAFDSYT